MNAASVAVALLVLAMIGMALGLAIAWCFGISCDQDHREYLVGAAGLVVAAVALALGAETVL